MGLFQKAVGGGNSYKLLKLLSIIFINLFAALTLTACGGGGGSSTPSYANDLGGAYGTDMSASSGLSGSVGGAITIYQGDTLNVALQLFNINSEAVADERVVFYLADGAGAFGETLADNHHNGSYTALIAMNTLGNFTLTFGTSEGNGTQSRLIQVVNAPIDLEGDTTLTLSANRTVVGSNFTATVSLYDVRGNPIINATVDIYLINATMDVVQNYQITSDANNYTTNLTANATGNYTVIFGVDDTNSTLNASVVAANSMFPDSLLLYVFPEFAYDSADIFQFVRRLHFDMDYGNRSALNVSLAQNSNFSANSGCASNSQTCWYSASRYAGFSVVSTGALYLDITTSQRINLEMVSGIVISISNFTDVFTPFGFGYGNAPWALENVVGEGYTMRTYEDYATQYNQYQQELEELGFKCQNIGYVMPYNCEKEKLSWKVQNSSSKSIIWSY